MIYRYLTGPRFRQRVEAIVEAFFTMQADLDKERKAIMKQWAKRQEQIERVMNATVGIYGDLQGLPGSHCRRLKGWSLLRLKIRMVIGKVSLDADNQNHYQRLLCYRVCAISATSIQCASGPKQSRENKFFEAIEILKHKKKTPIGKMYAQPGTESRI